MEPGDLFAVPPGHDSGVVGAEPYTSLRLLGTYSYTFPTTGSEPHAFKEPDQPQDGQPRSQRLEPAR